MRGKEPGDHKCIYRRAIIRGNQHDLHSRSLSLSTPHPRSSRPLRFIALFWQLPAINSRLINNGTGNIIAVSRGVGGRIGECSDAALQLRAIRAAAEGESALLSVDSYFSSLALCTANLVPITVRFDSR